MAIAPKSRWPRFGLRTLLALLTVAAVASWAYWDGWARWNMRRDQQQFLAQAKELKRGQLISHFWRPALKSYGPPFVSEEGSHDAKGRYTQYLACRWPNKLYVVFWRFKGSHCSSVEVFDLPAAPKKYVTKTTRSRIALKLQAGYIANPDPRGPRPPDVSIADAPSQLAYMLDFVEMISGDRRDDLGFEYTLIYSDPPATEPASRAY